MTVLRLDRRWREQASPKRQHLYTNTKCPNIPENWNFKYTPVWKPQVSFVLRLPVSYAVPSLTFRFLHECGETSAAHCVHCGPSAHRIVVSDRYVGVCRSKVEIGRSRGGIKQATRVIEVSKAEETNEKENEEESMG